jgi:putative ABC transport system substrate-binding protein
MDPRWASGDINRMRALAHELVGLQPDIIVSGSTPTTAALQRETQTIPIVIVEVADPVLNGFVAGLDRPGGNITGFASYAPSLGGKWLELLSEIAHGLKRAAIMFNPDTAPVSVYVPSFETAAASLKVEPIIASVHSNVSLVRDRLADAAGGLASAGRGASPASSTTAESAYQTMLRSAQSAALPWAGKTGPSQVRTPEAIALRAMRESG